MSPLLACSGCATALSFESCGPPKKTQPQPRHTNILSSVQTPQKHAPWKINMEHNNGGLENDFPLQLGDFLVPLTLIFRGV